MDLGNKIKELRLQLGITQEELANKIGVSYQAVSKWENGVTMPDIQLLPVLSMYFGITIDELFTMSHDEQLTRIQNALDNERFIGNEEYRYYEKFLLNMLRNNEEVEKSTALLGELYNKTADQLKEKASVYTKKALELNPYNKYYHNTLIKAEGGSFGDNYCNNHDSLIDFYKWFTSNHKEERLPYAYLFDQLMADRRFEEAAKVLHSLQSFGDHVENTVFKGDIEYETGNKSEAIELWKKNVKDYPNDFRAYFLRSQRMIYTGNYNQGAEDLDKASELQQSPRLPEIEDARTKAYELLKDYKKAAACQEKKLEILKKDYGILTGVQVEEVHRKIEELKRRG